MKIQNTLPNELCRKRNLIKHNPHKWLRGTIGHLSIIADDKSVPVYEQAVAIHTNGEICDWPVVNTWIYSNGNKYAVIINKSGMKSYPINRNVSIGMLGKNFVRADYIVLLSKLEWFITSWAITLGISTKLTRRLEKLVNSD